MGLKTDGGLATACRFALLDLRNGCINFSGSRNAYSRVGRDDLST